MNKMNFNNNNIVFFDPDYETIHAFNLICNFLIIESENNQLIEKLNEFRRFDFLFMGIEEDNFEAQISFLNHIKKNYILSEIIILSNSLDLHFIQSCFSNGATGFLNKKDCIENFQIYLEILELGGTVISPIIIKLLINQEHSKVLNDTNYFTIDGIKRKIISLIIKGVVFDEILLLLDIEKNILTKDLFYIYRYLEIKKSYQLRNASQLDIKNSISQLLFLRNKSI